MALYWLTWFGEMEANEGCKMNADTEHDGKYKGKSPTKEEQHLPGLVKKDNLSALCGELCDYGEEKAPIEQLKRMNETWDAPRTQPSHGVNYDSSAQRYYRPSSQASRGQRPSPYIAGGEELARGQPYGDSRPAWPPLRERETDPYGWKWCHGHEAARRLHQNYYYELAGEDFPVTPRWTGQH